MVILCVYAISARGEDWANTKHACNDWWSAKAQYHSAEECAIDFFTLQPIAITGGNIGSGSSLALGLRYLKPINPHGLETNLTIKGLYSFNSFYLLSGQYSMQLPNLPGVNGDLHPLINVILDRVDLRSQNFYGLGPSSTLSGLAVYREQLNRIGADAFVPISDWAGVGGDFHYLKPTIRGVSHTSTPSVADTYGELGAPGSTDKVAYLETGVKFGVQKSELQTWLPWESHAAMIQYRYFPDLDGSQHTFSQLAAQATATVTPKAHIDGDVQQQMNRTVWQNMLCYAEVGNVCKWGSLRTDGLMTASYVGATHSVPFYLQPTLGGTDIDGFDTLRGLADYRLRGPNRLLIQENFDKPLFDFNWKSPKTGALYGLGQYGVYLFFDAGNVAMKPADLSVGSLRTDYGVGISIALGNKVLGRMFWGFGAGEGTPFNAKLPSAFSAPPQ